MPEKPVATLWVEAGWVKARTPYIRSVTPEFRDELKSVIPKEYRKWDPIEKNWMVDPSRLDEFANVLKKYFKLNVIDTSEERTELVPTNGGDPYAAMVRLAPDDTLKRVYRIIASDIHPDKGGDPENMKKLNIAWQQIQRDRGIK